MKNDLLPACEEIKSLSLAVLELCLPEGISQSVSQSVIFKNLAINCELTWPVLNLHITSKILLMFSGNNANLHTHLAAIMNFV